MLGHLTSTEATFGVILSRAKSLEVGHDVLHAVLDLDSPGTVEWMFHLSYPCSLDVPEFKAEFGSFFLDDSRARLRDHHAPASVEGIGSLRSVSRLHGRLSAVEQAALVRLAAAADQLAKRREHAAL